MKSNPNIKNDPKITLTLTNLTISTQKKLPINKIVSLLDNFDIEVTDISTSPQQFKLQIHVKRESDFKRNLHNFSDIIQKALSGEITVSCKLYYFAYEGLNLREITLLRALIKYQKQLLYEFNENVIIKTLINHSNIVETVIRYFKERFQTQNLSLKNKIHDYLLKIEKIDDYKILHLLFTIVDNTLRTNYFLNKETISFKIATKNFKNLLFSIQPNLESFVYHNDFNGIHLRMSPISRGGIRYSDRKEDFREEIKDLVITQEAKNALIIPEGAKGGFVIFKQFSKEEFKTYYSLYIDALLDLIDVPDVNLVKYDDKDFYFVVAADRGTSDMSDVANEIAIKRGYFLKDAFASGGKTGYSHKKLGITAKGALTTTNRFFIEKEKNIFEDKITVVGVGSMRGDVFGNGLLLNKNFILHAAISHKEIFIDPNPDPKTAYEERKRLFENSLGWNSYDKTKISQGGGVFKRDEKEILLSEEIKNLIKTKKNRLSGEELAKAVLKLKVDLLYFGGIGTYVKSTEEENVHISDKQNENIRINANEINAFAVSEGANLALTIKARYEYAQNGGKINLDAIDNSAGVNISDYEVNLKIPLNTLILENKMSEKEKTEILKSLTNEVACNVLSNNAAHGLVLSLDQKRIYKEKFLKILDILENETDFFKRKNYRLPKINEIDSFVTKEEILRPALAIVMLYSKILTKKYILKNGVINCSFFDRYLKRYFPHTFYDKFEIQIKSHPLKNEIIATQITNEIINSYGIDFISDFHHHSFKYKIFAYIVLSDIIEIESVKKEIISNSPLNYQKLIEVDKTLKFAINWFVKYLENNDINPLVFLAYKEELFSIIREDSPFKTYEKWKNYYKFLPSIFSIKHDYKLSLNTIIELFKLIMDKFKISKILNTLNRVKPKNRLEKNLKDETEELIEFFVITMVTEIITSDTFNKNNLKKSFNSLIKPKREYFEDIIFYINRLEKNASLNQLIHITNSLILELLK